MRVRLVMLLLASLVLASTRAPSALAWAKNGSLPPSAQDYRDLILKIRPTARFHVSLPGNETAFDYQLSFGTPKMAQTLLADTPIGNGSGLFFRSFFDRIYLTDGSYLQWEKQKIPLTCVFVEGIDNRFSGKANPLIPDFLLKVYLVANDYSCTGPLKPGWPDTGGHEESWDTYLYYEIRDPTVMLPTEARLRYRWNELSAVLIDPAQEELRP